MARSISDEDHFDEADSHADRLFGFLRAWGFAEVILDTVIVTLMKHHDTRAPLPVFPATLERKLTYLKEAVDLHPHLAPAKRLAGKAIKLFMDEKGLRNHIVHGSPLQQLDDGTVHFMVLERRKRALPTYALRTVRRADWARLQKSANHAAAYLILLERALDPTEDSSLYRGDKLTSERLVGLPADLPVSKALRKLLNELFPMGV